MTSKPMSATLDNIKSVLGDDVAKHLLESFGGTVRHVPKRPHESHPWLALVGTESADKLCRAFGGRLVALPRQIEGHGRKKSLILELVEQGVQVQEIATRARCTQRYVYSVISTEGPDNEWRKLTLPSGKAAEILNQRRGRHIELAARSANALPGTLPWAMALIAIAVRIEGKPAVADDLHGEDVLVLIGELLGHAHRPIRPQRTLHS